MIEDPRRDAIHAKFLLEICRRVRDKHGPQPSFLLEAIMDEAEAINEQAIKEQVSNELVSLEESNQRAVVASYGNKVETNIACPKCGSRLLRSRMGFRVGNVVKCEGSCSNEECDWTGEIKV